MIAGRKLSFLLALSSPFLFFILKKIFFFCFSLLLFFFFLYIDWKGGEPLLWIFRARSSSFWIFFLLILPLNCFQHQDYFWGESPHFGFATFLALENPWYCSPVKKLIQGRINSRSWNGRNMERWEEEEIRGQEEGKKERKRSKEEEDRNWCKTFILLLLSHV